jgi:hypothetical protein
MLLRALRIRALTTLSLQTSTDDLFFSILLFIESWLKKGFADEDLKCTSMIKELVLPLVDSKAIPQKMEAEAKEITRLINDPDYVRRSRSSVDINVVANQDFLGPPPPT